MPQPTNYTPTTDFSQQEANNASGRSTVNTAALDAEFANIESTLDQTLNNLKLIQRDDGKLADVTVEVRTLAPDVLNVMGGFNLTGLWAASTYYSVNDICSNGEYTYVCKTAHTAGLSFDEQYWVQFGFTAGADAAQAAANAQISAANALISETAASSSAVAAAASASSAASSASSASTSASSAASSAYSASTSATNAANSASQAANSAASIGFTETSTTTFSNKTLLDAKLIRPQIGVSSTANNNFTLDASADNGTMKLARGNAGATTQDILTVDASGKVSAPQGYGDVIGSGQSWQDVTGSRAMGTTYTNATGRPIMILVNATFGSNWQTTINIAGLGAKPWIGGATNAPNAGTILIPAGATYVVAGATLVTWLELR